MPNKQAIIEDVKQSCGGASWLNIRETGRYLGMSDYESIKRFMGIAPTRMGKEKKYSALDIGQILFCRQGGAI